MRDTSLQISIIIKDISDLFDVPIPTIDMLWQWYCEITENNDSSFFELGVSVEKFTSVYKK